MRAVTLQQLAEVLKGGGRLVGMDVGTRNVGVAISDPLCRVASPQSTLRRHQSKNVQNMDDLDALVRMNSVAGFAIGYPLELGGHRSNQERMVKSFVSELELSGKFQNLYYLYWDERLTSAAMASMLAPLNVTGLSRQKLKDKLAAVSILQGCLDSLSLARKEILVRS